MHPFQNSPYIAAICGIQGYNEVTIHLHLMDMLLNNTWGTKNELLMFGILAGINVSYVCAMTPIRLNGHLSVFRIHIVCTCQ